MKYYHACVVDDEPLAARLITKYISDTPFLHLNGAYSSAQEAIKAVIAGDIDIIFLDINMPQLNGLEFARIIPSSARIIFTTAYEKYAIDGFKVNAIDYLLKPIDYRDFLMAAAKAVKSLEALQPAAIQTTSDRTIIVKSEYRLVQIHLRDILYLEGLKDYVKIYLDNGEKSVMTLMSLRTLEQELPSDIFMRVHRSFIVNVSKIRIMERNRIIFGNVAIPVSDSYKREFSEYVNARMIGINRQETALN